MLKIKQYITLVFLVLLTGLSYGNVKKQLVKNLCGSSISATGASMEVKIDDYNCLTTTPSTCGYTVNNTTVYTKLSFKDVLKTYYNYDWEVKVKYDIFLYDQNGNQIPSSPLTNKELIIDYRQTANYKDIDYELFKSPVGIAYYKAKVVIQAVEFNNLTTPSSPLLSSNIENDICMEVYLESDLSYEYDDTYNTYVHLPFSQYNHLKNELILHWEYTPGASYDLEILPIDVGTADLSSTNFDYDFTDAIRISTNKTQYNLPMAFPKSLILFRVRAVYEVIEPSGDKKRIEGKFSAQDKGTLLAPQYIYIQNYGSTAYPSNAYSWNDPAGILNSRTWQYSISYAEEGKSGQSITFYDDLMTPTQSVTLSNTEETAIVQTTAKDFLGRPAVSIMPAPVTSQGIRFYPDQAKSDVSGNDFNFTDFDLVGNYNSPAKLKTSTSKGSANYYSPDRTVTGGVNSDYIPDADGYTYARTIYLKDGTNRVAKQGGIGSTHTIGSGKETKYYYSTPTQTDLNRLFGSNVGLAKNYKKNMVVDPNGQASISYIDGSGRTIATALSGISVNGNENIDSRPATFPETTEYFKSSKDNVYNKTQVITTKSILCQSPGNYTFNYEVDPSAYINCLDGQCKYELVIYLFEKETGTIIPLTVDNSSGMTLTSSPNKVIGDLAPGQTATIQFSAILSTGTYDVVKNIRIPQATLTDLYAEYIKENDPYKETQTCFNFCAPEVNCDECGNNCETRYIEIEELVYGGQTITAKIYYNELGDTVGFEEFDRVTCTFINMIYLGSFNPTNGLQPILDSIAACKARCAADVEEISPCKATFEDMKGDMSKGGQYFDNHTNIIAGQTTNTWLESEISLLPPQAFINEHILMGQIPSGTTITWDIIRQYWQPEWAEGLVQYHPEFCAFETYCCATPTQDGSYTNINGSTISKKSYLIKDWDLTDPYFNMPGGCPGFNVDMTVPPLDKINAFLEKETAGTPNGTFYTLKEVAEATMSTTHSQYSFYHGTNGVVTAMGKDAFIIQFNTAFTQKVKYDLAKNGCDGDFPIPPVSNTNTREAQDGGFFVHFPFIDWNINKDSLKTANCKSMCEAEITRWMSEFHCIDAINFGSDENQLRKTLIDFCKEKNCDNTAGGVTFSLDKEGNATTYTANSFSQIINIYRQAYGLKDEICPTPSLLIDENRDQEYCGCDNVFAYAVDHQNTYGGLSFTVTRSQLPTNYSSLWQGGLESDLLAQTSDANSSNFSIAYDGCVLDAKYMSTSSAVTLPNIFDCSLLENDTTTEDPCAKYIADENKKMKYIAAQKYNDFIKQKAQEWIAGYTKNCVDNVLNTEEFKYKYTNSEYHYTLYYYDQSGNLVGTVSPEGVYQKQHNFSVIDKMDLKNTDINNNRIASGYTFVNPTYAMQTNYKYNSLNQLTEQTTPDGGKSTFFYDALNRLIVSQNKVQANNNTYSYTIYDELGRVLEVGEITNSTAPMTKEIAEDAEDFGSFDLNSTVSYTGTNKYILWLVANKSKRHQVVTTHYDEAPNFYSYSTYSGPTYTLTNLRNRISAVAHWEDPSQSSPSSASYYSYDYLGNVKKLIQQNNSTNLTTISGAIGTTSQVKTPQEYKVMDYEYDVISGNVNKVTYQKEDVDQFIHKYEYDANNRLTSAYSSRDGIIWDKESKNLYYLHGPLARTEIGDKQVQAQDYAYTLQGWLKAVNSSTGKQTLDMGKDGQAGVNNNFAVDAYGYSLHYFSGDYQASGSGANPGMLANLGTGDFSYANAKSVQQFNGNISKMVVGLTDENEERVQVAGKNYLYDQLNRIKEHVSYLTENSANDQIFIDNTFSPTSSLVHTRYESSYSYDGNGNIKNLTRKGSEEVTPVGSNINQSIDMDEFTYGYNSGSVTPLGSTTPLICNTNNRLDHVSDVYGNVTGTDLDNQSSGNYTYDDIGRLKSDVLEGITNIEWNVSNKITQITKSSGVDISFTYDPMGNRNSKKVIDNNTGIYTTTYYVRDAQGNTMATYKESNANAVTSTNSSTLYQLDDFHIYGSSRLGTKNEDLIIYDIGNNIPLNNYDETYRELGNKSYELSNHLGNVLQVISDRKLVGHSTGSLVDFYTANVISFSDYYPFGMLMPNRYTGNSDYRYGFNGMERDNEIQGDGNSYNTHFRKYDPRIGRWLSRDPKTLPNESPYCAFLNNPVFYTDGEGDCPWCIKILLDFGAGVAADVFVQVIAEYAFGDANSIQEAFDNVDWWQAIVSGGENVLPGGKHTKAIISGVVDVSRYYFNSDNPTLEGAAGTFAIGTASAYMGDFIGKYGAKKVALGLKKMGIDWSYIKKATGVNLHPKYKGKVMKHPHAKSNPDKEAIKWAKEVGGESQVGFEVDINANKAAAREFDVITDKFIGQHKVLSGNSVMNSKARKQMRHTFEAAMANGREVVYKFDYNSTSVVKLKSYMDNIKRLEKEFGVKATVKTKIVLPE